MKVISSDTNVWFDFNSISRIDLPFKLRYHYVMYKEALRKEIIAPPELLDSLKKEGLEGIDITIEEFTTAQRLKKENRKISGYDSIALAIAIHRKYPLLTGDNALRKAGIKEGVTVIGTIGLLDKLVEEKRISSKEYVDCLKELRDSHERRLPREELQNRIDNLYKGNAPS